MSFLNNMEEERDDKTEKFDEEDIKQLAEFFYLLWKLDRKYDKINSE